MHNTVGRIQITERIIQNAEFRMQNTECKIQNAEFRMQSTDYRMQNTEYRIRMHNTESRMHSTEYSVFCICVLYSVTVFYLLDTKTIFKDLPKPVPIEYFRMKLLIFP